MDCGLSSLCFSFPSTESKIYETFCDVLTKRVCCSLAENVVTLSAWQMVLFAKGLDMHTFRQEDTYCFFFNVSFPMVSAEYLMATLSSFKTISVLCLVLRNMSLSGRGGLVCSRTMKHTNRQIQLFSTTILFLSRTAALRVYSWFPSLVPKGKWITWCSH
jgi:hypothetical protein